MESTSVFPSSFVKDYPIEKINGWAAEGRKTLFTASYSEQSSKDKIKENIKDLSRKIQSFAYAGDQQLKQKQVEHCVIREVDGSKSYTSLSIGWDYMIYHIEEFASTFETKNDPNTKYHITAFFIKKILRDAKRPSPYGVKELLEDEKRTFGTVSPILLGSLQKIENGFVALEEKEKKKALKAAEFALKAAELAKQALPSKVVVLSSSSSSSSNEETSEKSSSLTPANPYIKISETKELKLNTPESEQSKMKYPTELAKKTKRPRKVVTSDSEGDEEKKEPPPPASRWTLPKIFGFALIFGGIGYFISNRYSHIRDCFKKYF